MDYQFIDELLILLTTGLVAGFACRQWSLPPLMGYLVVGAAIGQDGLGWVHPEQEEIKHLAELGVFFLLFSIGLELSLEELRRMSRFMLAGGPVQMLTTGAPVAAVLVWFDWSWQTAALVGLALAFSSTVLVFKALGELGRTGWPIGRRSIAILLFQDAALVPLLLCIPLLAGTGETVGVKEWIELGVSSAAFLVGTVGLWWLLSRVVIPRITQHRSADLVVLLTLTVLGVVTLVAHRIGLPPAIGALAAGLAFGGNRWSEQIDSLILPFREAFSAIFFVSLGLLVEVSAMVEEPLLMLGGMAGLMLIKTTSGTLAFRLTGTPWKHAVRPAAGMAHVGEFAFVLMLLAASAGVLDAENQQRLIGIAGGTLLLSPLLIRWGFDVREEEGFQEPTEDTEAPYEAESRRAVVIGMGPVGRAVVSRLETHGYEVRAVDLNPLNLQAFAQFGIPVVAGNAETPSVLRSAGVDRAGMVIICVPVDEVATRVTAAVREMNDQAQIIVRCRYARNSQAIRRARADHVFAEEAYTAIELIKLIETPNSKA